MTRNTFGKQDPPRRRETPDESDKTRFRTRLTAGERPAYGLWMSRAVCLEGQPAPARA